MDPNNQQQPQQTQPGGQQPQAMPQGQPQPQQPGGGQRLRIDDNMLQDLGLGTLPPAEKNKLLAQIYETLEMRVGMTLANKMTDQQLQEFEGFINSNDEGGALSWLEGNFPDYKQVVAQELENLKGEISQNSQAIMQAVNNPQQPGQPQPAPQQMQQPQMQQPQPGQQIQPQQPMQQPVQPQQPYDPNQPQ